MKLIDTRLAVGHVLCHDMTQIIRGEFKGARFRKGHIVTEADIPVLLSMGKERLYVYEAGPGILHEDEAAQRLCALCKNENMTATEVKEGKIELLAAIDGLFQVDFPRLSAVNGVDELMIATRRGNTAVRKGDKLAGMRVIPLTIAEKMLDRAAALAGKTPILRLLPYRLSTAGVITTGSEVFHHRIADTFTPVVADKLRGYGIEMSEHLVTDDHIENICAAIAQMQAKKVDLILVTGGMSVDPDDNTPGAIRKSGAQIITYGAPVLPGAMFLLAYDDGGTPIVGLPGCVMYAKATIFDLVLPRIAAGERLSRDDFVAYGEGGLCLSCEHCHYPDCPFGR